MPFVTPLAAELTAPEFPTKFWSPGQFKFCGLLSSELARNRELEVHLMLTATRALSLTARWFELEQ